MECSDYIAIIALIISVITFFVQIYPNRLNLKCHKNYLWETCGSSGDKRFYCLTSILENRSRLPISVTSIALIVGDFEYMHHNEKTFLYGGSYPTTNDDKEVVKIMSNEFPVNIDYLSAKTIRTIFNLNKEITTNKVSLRINTTRGEILVKDIEFSKEQY